MTNRPHQCGLYHYILGARYYCTAPYGHRGSCSLKLIVAPPHESDAALKTWSHEELEDEVKRLRAGVRQHRDERGDDRCWLDDARLYKMLPEQEDAHTELPPREVFLANCERFHANRQGYIKLEPKDKALDKSVHDAEVRGIELRGIEAAAALIELHGRVSRCCDAQPGNSEAKALAACVRKNAHMWLASLANRTT